MNISFPTIRPRIESHHGRFLKEIIDIYRTDEMIPAYGIVTESSIALILFNSWPYQNTRSLNETLTQRICTITEQAPATGIT